jgi:hypothetical protein
MGVSGYARSEATGGEPISISPGEFIKLAAVCPGVKKVLGGGGFARSCEIIDEGPPVQYISCDDVGVANYALEASYPDRDSDNTWIARVRNTGEKDIIIDFRVYAICGFVQE